MRLIAQSMAEVAIRLAEPESVARESIVTVGQAIRREVAAMGDGVERALARAAELETLVHNEVSALERAYNDNEVRIRGLLDDLASSATISSTQAEQVRDAITSVHLDLSQDITSVSDLVAERVNETAAQITRALAEKGEHITVALGRAGDSMIDALGERGGDLLERLERTSHETTHAISVRQRADDLEPRFQDRPYQRGIRRPRTNLTQMMAARLDRVSENFAERSHRHRRWDQPFAGRHRRDLDTVEPDGRNDRDACRRGQQYAEGDRRFIILDLSLRGGDVVAKLEQGQKITDTIDHPRHQRHRDLPRERGKDRRHRERRAPRT